VNEQPAPAFSVRIFDMQHGFTRRAGTQGESSAGERICCGDPFIVKVVMVVSRAEPPNRFVLSWNHYDGLHLADRTLEESEIPFFAGLPKSPMMFVRIIGGSTVGIRMRRTAALCCLILSAAQRARKIKTGTRIYPAGYTHRLAQSTQFKRKFGAKLCVQKV
jgi:hypothetical protein